MSDQLHASRLAAGLRRGWALPLLLLLLLLPVPAAALDALYLVRHAEKVDDWPVQRARFLLGPPYRALETVAGKLRGSPERRKRPGEGFGAELEPLGKLADDPQTPSERFSPRSESFEKPPERFRAGSEEKKLAAEPLATRFEPLSGGSETFGAG